MNYLSLFSGIGAPEETKGTNSRQWVYDTNGIISTLSATDYKQPKQILQIGTLDIKGNDQIRRVYGL